MSSKVRENLTRILDEIRETELKAGREEGSVKLLAVSKFHPVESVLEAYGCGQRLFGENRVQEALEKFSMIDKTDVELHLIGSLQRNKVGKILPIADCIQSVDRLELLTEIDRRLGLNSTVIEKSVQKVLLEIHTGEDSKSGYKNEKELYESIDFALASGKIIIQGLMTMAPFTDDEKIIRGSFQKICQLKQRLISRYPELDLSVMSMGMSNDYKIAIEEGSTMVRIGTAIFGTRK